MPGCLLSTVMIVLVIFFVLVLLVPGIVFRLLELSVAIMIAVVIGLFFVLALLWFIVVLLFKIILWPFKTLVSLLKK